MPKRSLTGEMPFLDHLEELRWRILWSLLALAVGTVVGFFLVERFDVLAILKQPIAPYLPDGKLHILAPADAFLITLKLAFAAGIVFAFPVVVAQVWRFVTPALYEHERRYIVPALLAGFGLFLVGATMGYLWILPAILKILFSFQSQDLAFMITANAYFGFATQMIIAFGLLFELPLLMVLLSALGVVSPDTFAKQRPIALILAAVAAAVLTPPDAMSMLMMLGPILFLYEAGIFLARLMGRRRKANGNTIGTAALILLLAAVPRAGHAQGHPPPPGGAAGARDSLGNQAVDTATARKLGLPTQPSRAFPAADSVIRALMQQPGFTVLRYAADTITLFGETKEIVLDGSALVEREGTTLEADSISFFERECLLRAAGHPVLFEAGTVLVGEGMRYDTCERHGSVATALTSFQQSGVTWYLRGGGLGIDSASVRVYGARTDISSCDLPEPHYHFAASKVKWVSNTLMVARPATLYVRDIPVLWLPFIFQDMRQGRRSGMLVPRFGFSDLIRPNTGYQRHISNIGYYFALNDYTDVQASLEWFAGNYVAVNGQFRYRWLDRFVTGGLGVSRIYEQGTDSAPGARSLRLQWNHNQAFDQRTRLTAAVDYATSARVVQRNTVDPYVQTATLGSRVNFSKQYDWGTVTLGGSRSQDLSNGTIQQTLPSLSLSPRPIDLARNITWSPSLSVTNANTFHQTPGLPVIQPPSGGVPVTDTLFTGQRNTSLSLATPLRLGQWNWQNSVQVTDFHTDRPPAALVLPDPASPGDSLTRFYAEDFRTEVDWSTGINLPILLASRWKLQPTIGIRNSTSGAFLVRNQYTNGQFVSQGKRLTFGASLSPTFFGFFPGVGPLSRIRHSIAPRLTWTYAPAASVPEEYARAQNPTGNNLQLRSPVLHSLSFQLSQTFEGKLKAAEGDTSAQREVRKLKLLSIQTSPITFDIEQAKQPGRTGWQTKFLSNQFTSDLLPGFSLSMTHDLWDGPVGYDSTRFDPFVTSISARFSVSAQTFRSVVSLLTGGGPLPGGAAPAESTTVNQQEQLSPTGSPLGPAPGAPSNLGGQVSNLRTTRGGGFRASVTYDDQRSRPTAAQLQSATPASAASLANRTLGLNVSFAPTPGWGASWSTQYNLTTHEFGQHVLRLDRDLHRWRATFAFVKAPNGNFAFNFFVSLLDQPDIKFQYDQRTVNR